MKDFQNFQKKIKKIIKKAQKESLLTAIIVILIAVFSTLSSLGIFLKKEIVNNAILKSGFNFFPSFYPQLSLPSVLRSQDSFPSITASSFVVFDPDSSAVLLQKNENLRFSMASTTKIMTALTALDDFKMEDILTVYDSAIEGAKIGLKEGEKITFENLLYAMLLPSANDAGATIAQNYKDGEEKFVEKMNEKAQLLNLENTHFSDPVGLNDNGNYSSPLDLARLSAIALKNKIFAQIVSTKYKNISDLSGNNIYELENLNKLLGLDGVNGVKTGYTEEAGEVLAVSRMSNGHTLITVVMKSKDRFGDTEKLLSIVDKSLTYTQY